VEAVLADERKTDFKLLTFGQIRQQKKLGMHWILFLQLEAQLQPATWRLWARMKWRPKGGTPLAVGCSVALGRSLTWTKG
jgi:hypothetical protein